MPTSKTTTKKSVQKPKVIAKAQNADKDAENVSDAHKSRVRGFTDFIREQGVIGLAVGLAIGAAAGASVKAIVDGLINPVVGFIIGGINLTKLQWVVVAPHADGKGGLIFSWGAVVSSLITLIATALVIYIVIHTAKLDRIDKKKEA
jgi:large conductance mechanosensitive channel